MSKSTRKIRNRSWRQADKLVRRHVLPRWAKLPIDAISRQDAKAMFRGIAAPMVANQTVTAASAIFNWAVREELLTVNPCSAIDLHPRKSRERVLASSELPLAWRAFDAAGLYKAAALKVILLTGQRPGEVRHMRREHIVDGWCSLNGFILVHAVCAVVACVAHANVTHMVVHTIGVCRASPAVRITSSSGLFPN